MLSHYKHFNAAALVDAAMGYEAQIKKGSKMMVTLAGAMSTAEIGRSLAEMIRQDKVHIISCTGANLEEDIMNLVAHNHYERIPGYRDLTPEEEKDLLERGLNRVTDTCIPEKEAFRKLEKHMLTAWKEAEEKAKPQFPHEYIYKLLVSGDLEKYYQADPDNSWVLAAAKKQIPLIVPGWEDSTLGNIFTSYCLKRELQPATIRSGIEYMSSLAEWYETNSRENEVGFFQIGGGIAGDFPICVVFFN